MTSHIKQSSARRGEVYWVNLDPTIGTETKKTRPAVIISNDANNRVGQRYIVAPITTNINYILSTETKINVNGKFQKVMLDQIRTIDHQRLGTKLSKLSLEEMRKIENALKIVLHLS